ncbi:MAG: LLM class F420-dependent oxidoreductase [Acidimicrobiia bacterium]|nr:LLM class F420-dependent oxidoreductase [Acidimicrobiia bacterium]
MNHAPGVTFASFAGLGLHAGLDAARWATELGYGSFWTAETTGPEAFATLAAVGAAQPSLDLGTGVLALQVRSPMVAAMGAATLTELGSDRRVLLGVGVSSPVVTERWHGVPYGDRPLRQTREYLEVVRAILDGDAVTYEGEHYQLRRSRLGVRLGERRPELVLGALGERMLQLAGELADGVLLNYLPAAAVPWCVEQVHAGEDAAGRPRGSCTIYAYVHVGVCDRSDALPKARRDLFSYAVVEAYATAFARAGFAEEVDAIRERHAAGDRDGAVAAVSERMVDAIDVVGDADHVAATVAAYRAGGVDVPVIMPLPWGADRLEVVRATMEAAAPEAT